MVLVSAKSRKGKGQLNLWRLGQPHDVCQYYGRARRRRQGQRQFKKTLLFKLRISRYPKVIKLFLTVKIISKLNKQHKVRRPRSPDDANVAISRCCFAEDGQ